MDKADIQNAANARSLQDRNLLDKIKQYLDEHGSSFVYREIFLSDGELVIGRFGEMSAEDLPDYAWVTIIRDERSDAFEVARAIGIAKTDAPYSEGIVVYYVSDDDNVVQTCYYTDLDTDIKQIAYLITDGEPFDMSDLPELGSEDEETDDDNGFDI